MCGNGVIVLFVAIYNIIWERLLELSCSVARYNHLTKDQYDSCGPYLCNVKILAKDQYLPVRLHDGGIWIDSHLLTGSSDVARSLDDALAALMVFIQAVSECLEDGQVG